MEIIVLLFEYAGDLRLIILVAFSASGYRGLWDGECLNWCIVALLEYSCIWSTLSDLVGFGVHYGMFKLASKIHEPQMIKLKIANGWSLYQAMKKALVGCYAVDVCAGLQWHFPVIAPVTVSAGFMYA